MANATRISKFMSLVLRHKPQTIGIELDEAGWVDIDTLVTAMNQHPGGRGVTRDKLLQVVADNDKQRFCLSDDGQRIRARQGHSVEVALGLQPATPPEHLLHGTPQQNVAPIRESGLRKMNRNHVHLHAERETAQAVGARRGKPVLLSVRSGEMHRDGHEFFVTGNNVWLTDHVPSEYIDFPTKSK